MPRRRHAVRKRATGRSLLVRLTIIAIIAGLGWWSFRLYSAIHSHVTHYPTGQGHSFMTTNTDQPIVLVIQVGSQDNQLESLSVMRLDYTKRSLDILQLPSDLSDGTTTAAQYLTSGYYKELQQMVEHALALPLTGYIIQPSTSLNSGAVNWPQLWLRQPKPSWWQTTIGLPWWLQNQPALKTNLSPWQLAQALWVARDADDSLVTHQPADATAFSQHDGLVVVDPTILDPIVAEVLLGPAGEQSTSTVVVKNATDVSGLAALMARYAKHLGGEVIAIEAADSSQTGSSVKSETRTNLGQNMQRLLGIPFDPTPRTGRERADVELIIGVDVLNRVGEPSLPAGE